MSGRESGLSAYKHKKIKVERDDLNTREADLFDALTATRISGPVAARESERMGRWRCDSSQSVEVAIGNIANVSGSAGIMEGTARGAED